MYNSLSNSYSDIHIRCTFSTYFQKQEELARRIEMIKEIRVLESISGEKDTTYDETQTSGIGLLCEMSIAEVSNEAFIVSVLVV